MAFPSHNGDVYECLHLMSKAQVRTLKPFCRTPAQLSGKGVRALLLSTSRFRVFLRVLFRVNASLRSSVACPFCPCS